MSERNPIRVGIADDHSLFRTGLAGLVRDFDMDVVFEAADGQQLVDQVLHHKPDVALVDIEMPKLNGIEAARKIYELAPATRVIALTMYDDDHLISKMIAAGCASYMLKNATDNELESVIRRVVEVGYFFNEHLTADRLRTMLTNIPAEQPDPEAIDFNPRERRVLQHICEQMTDKEIAEAMNLSVATIHSCRLKLLQKTQSRNAVGLVVYAFRKGLVAQQR